MWTEQGTAQIKKKQKSWQEWNVNISQLYQQNKEYSVPLWENNARTGYNKDAWADAFVGHESYLHIQISQWKRCVCLVQVLLQSKVK